MFFTRLALIGLVLLTSSLEKDPRVIEIPGPPCPIIEIKCEPGCGGNNTKLRVELSGGPKFDPKYTWCASAGIIARGQGADRIELDLTDTSHEDRVTVVVIIGGLDGACDDHTIYRFGRRSKYLAP